MLSKAQVFITGATGYIGGVVLEHLLRHHTAPASNITALVRNPTKIPLFTSIGVKTVLGSLNDVALLERHASESDIMFACADADHVQACEAILRGLKKRHEVMGIVPVLVHTSRTGVLMDNARGMYAYKTIWDDMDLDQLETLPDTWLHRKVNLLVIAADKQGYVCMHIVLPSTIYNFPTGAPATLGIQNLHSIQILRLVSASIMQKRAGMVGLGLNKWPNVHIDDVGDLYIILYDAILDGRAGHGREGLYFGENGEHELRTICEKIGKALVNLGVSPPNEQTPMSFDEMDYVHPNNRYLMNLGTNSQWRSNQACELGWRPKYTTKDMLKSVRGEVEWQLKHMGGE